MIYKIWPGILSQKSVRRFKYFKEKYPTSNFKVKALGNPILNAVFKISPENASSSNKYVIKQISGILNKLKWLGIRIITVFAIKYDINDLNRLQNEINGLKFCAKYSIGAPRLYDQLNTRLVVDYIEGIPLDEFDQLSAQELITSYAKFGSILSSEFHAKGYSIGDCKAENIIFNRDLAKLFIVDFEQFRKLEAPNDPDDVKRQAWEINEFIFYLGHYFPRAKGYKMLDLIIKAFLSNYFKSVTKLYTVSKKQQQIMNQLGRLAFSWMYIAFMNPFTLKEIYRIINHWRDKVKLNFDSFEQQ